MTEARTALVTGASRGIGFGIALRLAEEGFRTAIVKLMTFLSISDSPEMKKFFEEELTPENATSGRWKQEISSPEFDVAYEKLVNKLNGLSVRFR